MVCIDLRKAWNMGRTKLEKKYGREKVRDAIKKVGCDCEKCVEWYLEKKDRQIVRV